MSGSISPELEAVEVSVAALKTERESQERIVFRILMLQIEDLANYSKNKIDGKDILLRIKIHILIFKLKLIGT